MFRKFALIGILTVLAGCETLSGVQRDFDNLMEVTGIDSDIFPMPEGKATKAPEILPSTINPRTGIVIQSEQNKVDAKAKKASSKKNTSKKKPKNKIISKNKATTVKKESSAIQQNIAENIKKNPLCPSAPIDTLENVSQLYHFYYKKPKICKAQDYFDKAIDIYRLVLTHKDHQDIRLLNADHGFARFTMGIMRYASQDVRKNGASFLKAKGCGLIANDKCNYIININ